MDSNYIEISEKRKKEHIENFLKGKSRNSNLFGDVVLDNNSFPELDFSEIVTDITFLGKKIDYPVMINAATGGFDGALEINRGLAELAGRFNIPMAVGSQSLGLKSGNHKSYKVVREVLKDKVVLANLSAHANLDDVSRAIDMVKADGVQLHLNAPQEMCMEEGDRHFRGVLDNIEYVSRRIEVPVIVKEVGFGMSKTSVKRLVDMGIEYVDIGGKGGTNFIEIEDLRNKTIDYSDLYDWGIPTAACLLQCRELKGDIKIIASGGMESASDIVKSLSLNSELAAVCGVVLRRYLERGYKAAEKLMEEIFHKMKVMMMLLGCRSIEDLRNLDPMIKGELKEWMRD
ncbi:isopentenyl-diphosphate delta-isomerase [Dethiosulfatibacter aminovorans DSM 17477]|uniref:Isopentenyl-diphosphate delta-isomerase n=1 Tax=Dethiosulfatibacter aminovorans DSM 17477 TaxID=1121476 RepID=A0A1M6BW39_9FIRM|nr:type 2 isopentenyl-diphosphate Delta-isomerase [Dethiosulfatibacter aminovorans]SHI52970.1 isopentenyl-diphosphate delta-isomerase [Dethiosulfatibacter aminovorans DSM 17477]